MPTETEKQFWEWLEGEDDSSFRFSTPFDEDPNSGKDRESWVKLIPVGAEIYIKGHGLVKLPEEDLKEIVRETRKMNHYFDEIANGSAYRQPIWKDHHRSAEKEGSVMDIKMADKRGFNGIWTKLRRTPDAEEKIQNGSYEHVSAGIHAKYQRQESEETFGPVIREVSFTSDPKLKNNGKIQDTLDVELSNYLAEGGPNMPEELQNKLDAMMDAMEAMMVMIEDMQKEEDDEETDEEDEMDASSDSDKENEEMSQDEDETVEANQEDVEDDDSLTLSAIEDLIDSKFSELTTQRNVPRTRQGSPETPDLNLSYEEKIEKIMKKNDCGRMKAIELEFKQAK